jgi:hypothetical protein
METGSLIPVYEESRIRQTYVVPKGKTKEKTEVPTWRLKFYPKKEEAENFAKEYSEVAHLYADSNRKALPIREKADRLSQRIYRLRENERVKILELGTTPSDENGLKGFWYKVLTEEGVTGYCFDYYLTLIDGKTNSPLPGARTPEDEATARILTTNWRPIFFREMIAERRIDLVKFRPSYGLFFSSESKQIKIVLPAQSVTIPFSQIREIRPGLFQTEAGAMQFQPRGRTELIVFYTVNGSQRSDIFYSFEQEIEEVITAEQERRKAVFESFLRRGTSLNSNAYGKIDLSPERGFVWSGFERLVPQTIPEGTRGVGSVDFSVFIAREIRTGYDGVVSFRFTGQTGERPLSFLYNFTDQGVRFIHVPPGNIEDNIVRRETPNPLVIFFTFS